MNQAERFRIEKQDSIARLGRDEGLIELGRAFIERTGPARYSYNFTWMGRPIIQFPQDMVAMQEIIWEVRPDLIIETGVAHGGSLVYYASLLELLGGGAVLGIDIDIRAHNRSAIEGHPMAHRIRLLQGSSTDPAIVAAARTAAESATRVMVLLDSNHTDAHVAAELVAYSPLVTVGSYLVVFDTVVDRMPPGYFPDRPWGPDNNPMTAVRRFLRSTDRFRVDREICDKLLITVAPQGYLRRVR